MFDTWCGKNTEKEVKTVKLLVNVKKISKKQNEVSVMELEYPEGMMTVRDLLDETVKLMVKAYSAQAKKGEALHMLTGQEIADKSVTGKIGFGIVYGKKLPDPEKSIQAARECFQDGMVALFIDGVRYEELEGTLNLKQGSELTFVRLIPLVGRMW